MSSDELYSKTVLDHFKNPRNLGEIKGADGVATGGNPACGDVTRLFIKIGKRNGEEFIEEVKFQTLGCGAAIASSSMISEMIKGRPLKEALKITNQAVVRALGGLPQNKIHCSVLAEDVLKKVIEDYQKKKGGIK